MKKIAITIPFTEEDLDDLRDFRDFNWWFPGTDENGEEYEIQVKLTREEEN